MVILSDKFPVKYSTVILSGFGKNLTMYNQTVNCDQQCTLPQRYNELITYIELLVIMTYIFALVHTTQVTEDPTRLVTVC